MNSSTELREQIKNCFKRNHMQTEGDTELFDTELTIDNLLALIEKAKKAYWLRGYEAGRSVSSGEMKGISWDEVKKDLLKDPEFREAYEALNQANINIGGE